MFFTLFGAFYAWQIATFLLGIPRLMGMYRFYTHLLNIPNVSA
jgi:autophagy-related protein 9